MNGQSGRRARMRLKELRDYFEAKDAQQEGDNLIEDGEEVTE